jgi:molecular chaperone DnaK (HSP70)
MIYVNFQSTMPGMSLVEAIPLSVGVSTQEGVFDPLIPRNTSIPTQSTKNYVTGLNNQTAMGFGVSFWPFIIKPCD